MTELNEFVPCEVECHLAKERTWEGHPPAAPSACIALLSRRDERSLPAPWPTCSVAGVGEAGRKEVIWGTQRMQLPPVLGFTESF